MTRAELDILWLRGLQEREREIYLLKQENAGLRSMLVECMCPPIPANRKKIEFCRCGCKTELTTEQKGQATRFLKGHRRQAGAVLAMLAVGLLAGCASHRTDTTETTLPPMPMTAPLPLLTPHAMDAQAVLPPEPAPPARTNLTLQWCCDGDLSNVMTGVQCATNINGPWLTVATMPASATNRWTDNDLTATQKFYRAFNAWNQ